jgi:hypothetical protein
LQHELKSANFCVADLSGTKPNVMWEVGYAMALGKPLILTIQDLTQMPFDLRDMQTLEYDRARLRHTLSEPLRSMVLDTLRAPSGQNILRDQREDLMGSLLTEVQQLKVIVAESVKAWNSATSSVVQNTSSPALYRIEGAWVNRAGGSHYYAKVINSELIVPYCFGGNKELTGVYYGWRLLGEHWFARFQWLSSLRPHGFAFMKQESLNSMTGAWWYDYEFPTVPEAIPDGGGVSAHWERLKGTPIPSWAATFLADVERQGLAGCLTAR